jgi:hypothetical protein
MATKTSGVTGREAEAIDVEALIRGDFIAKPPPTGSAGKCLGQTLVALPSLWCNFGPENSPKRSGANRHPAVANSRAVVVLSELSPL